MHKTNDKYMKNREHQQPNPLPSEDKNTDQTTVGRKRWGEIFRFCMVGVAATLMQYIIYHALIMVMIPNAALAVSYVICLLFNYVASLRYTFRVNHESRKVGGFILAHMINLGLQVFWLDVFIHAGMDKRWAPIPMFAICVPINFVLVRRFLTASDKRKKLRNQ